MTATRLTLITWWATLCLGARLPIVQSAAGADPCAGAGRTQIWIGVPGGGADVGVPLIASGQPGMPLLNVASEATLPVWLAIPDGLTLTDIALDANIVGDTFAFRDAGITNPSFSIGGTTGRRFQHTPDASITDRTITALQGYTVVNPASTAVGLGPSSSPGDPAHVGSENAWQLGSIQLANVNTTPGTAAASVFLRLGANGIQFRQPDDLPTSITNVGFGGSDDATLCSLSQLQTASDKADASLIAGRYHAASGLHTGTYWQASDARMLVSIRGASSTNFRTTGAMQLAGQLDLQLDAGYTPPSTAAAPELRTILKAAEIRGRFDQLMIDGLVTESVRVEAFGAYRETFHHDNGLFWLLEQAPAQLSVGQFRALPGDTDGSGRVDFADFLGVSRNFGQAGDWTDGEFTGDGVIQFADFLALAQNFGRVSFTHSPVPASPVPEPGGLSLAIAMGLGLLGRHRRYSA